MKKFLIIIGVLLITFCGFLLYDRYSHVLIPVLDIEEDRIDVDKIYIYGSHLNMEGNYNFEENTDLVLYDGEFISYKINSLDNGFNLLVWQWKGVTAAL